MRRITRIFPSLNRGYRNQLSKGTARSLSIYPQRVEELPQIEQKKERLMQVHVQPVQHRTVEVIPLPETSFAKSYFHHIPLRSKEKIKAEINCTLEFKTLPYCELADDELDSFVESIKERAMSILINNFLLVKLKGATTLQLKSKTEKAYLENCLRLIGLISHKVGVIPSFKEARVTYPVKERKRFVL